ncbi:MAG TPA: lectin-like protein [Kofleriaceae bacterium]|nr:lectin-like protein [Kofleriaceae bacterium]
MDGEVLMRTLLLLLALSSAACLRQTEFKCTTSADCSASGAVCEANSYCSFVDPNCASGRRFGDLSGSVAGQCVGGNTGVDGGVDTMTDGGGNGNCPATYAAVGGQAHRYRVIAGMAVWMVQKTACAADGANAYLAVPDNATELQALVTTAATAHVWVGIDDQTTEGTYQTTKGGTVPANDPMWDTGEPDNAPLVGGGQADCVVGVMANAKLADDGCAKTYPAICECEP